MIARALGGITRQPISGTTYAAGDDLGGSNIVVYAGSGSSVTVPNLEPQIYNVAVYAFSKSGTTNIYTLDATYAAIEALGMPSITGNPAPKVLYEGRTAKFTGSAVGTSPLRYQWKKEAPDLADGSRISGATTPALTITGVTVADAGSYTLSVINDAGSVSGTPATLTVLTPSGGAYEASVISYEPEAYWRLK